MKPPSDDSDIARLEPDTIAALDASQASAPVDESLARRVRHRVMERIAALEDRHLTVQAGPEEWQPFGDGVQIKVLHESGGVMSYLLRLAAGAVLPAHRHPMDEECVVLEGSLRIGELVVPAGGFHLARANSLHDRITTEAGATIYLRGAVPSAEQCV